jgi:hypothetical protein
VRFVGDGPGEALAATRAALQRGGRWAPRSTAAGCFPTSPIRLPC